jgi:hypothetical protein
MSIEDLPGAKTKTRKIVSSEFIMIEGTAPKKTYVRQTAHDSFAYHDVYRNTWSSQRCINPLDPVYTLRDNGEGFRAGFGDVNAKYGSIKGSKPPGLPLAK